MSLQIKLKNDRTVLTTNELIRTLREVQRLGSMSKAAKSLFLTTPAVVHRLDMLSDRVGGAVVEPKKFMGTGVTPLGQRVCREWEPLAHDEGVRWDLERRYPRAIAALRDGGRRSDVMEAEGIKRGLAQRICKQWRETHAQHEVIMWQVNEKGERVLEVGEGVTAVLVPVGGMWVLQVRLTYGPETIAMPVGAAEQTAVLSLSAWANELADKLDDLLIEQDELSWKGEI